MKSINTLLSALFFLSAIVGITSCTEEADYTPAQKPENAQVYFATDEASTVSLETGQQSLDRKSTRLNSSHWNKSRMPSSA